jgi:hypothetical protein
MFLWFGPSACRCLRRADVETISSRGDAGAANDGGGS